MQILNALYTCLKNAFKTQIKFAFPHVLKFWNVAVRVNVLSRIIWKLKRPVKSLIFLFSQYVLMIVCFYLCFSKKAMHLQDILGNSYL